MDSPILFVLAGGFGTRLRSVVSDVPKPLAPVHGKPFLQYLLESWKEQGIQHYVFLLHYEAQQIIDFVNSPELSAFRENMKLEFVIEPEPLGTGGAVKYAMQQVAITDDFLVTNADTWLSSGIDKIKSANAPCIATVDVADVSRYGAVQSESGLVEAFLEKQNSASAGQINAGMYLLNKESFENCEKTKFSIEKDIFPELVKNKKLSAANLSTDFIDIGIPEDYYRFGEWVRNRIV